jgi:hypothetical protein
VCREQRRGQQAAQRQSQQPLPIALGESEHASAEAEEERGCGVDQEGCRQGEGRRPAAAAQQQCQAGERQAVAGRLHLGQTPGEGKAVGRPGKERSRRFGKPCGALKAAKACDQQHRARKGQRLGGALQSEPGAEQSAERVVGRGVDAPQARLLRHQLHQTQVRLKIGAALERARRKEQPGVEQ